MRLTFLLPLFFCGSPFLTCCSGGIAQDFASAAFSAPFAAQLNPHVTSTPVSTPVSGAPSTPSAVNTGTLANAMAKTYFTGLAVGNTQFVALCNHGNQDRFTQWYCAANTPPSIASFTDVLVGLGLHDGNDLTSGTQFAFIAETASLSSREITSLNPEAIIYSDASPFLTVAFARGESVVEIAARTTTGTNINFYLMHYKIACDANDTCTTRDRYLPSNESHWLSVDVYDGHMDLKNTVLNCDVCHRPAGFDFANDAAQPAAVLRMQELLDPWTHWFRGNRGSAKLLSQYCAAHTSNESYAGVPGSRICNQPEAHFGDPAIVETNLIQAFSYELAPNVALYDGQSINQDDPNFTGPPSAAWLAMYASAVAGNTISPPYFAIDPFDSVKLAGATAAYQKIAMGSPGDLPDLADIFLDSALPYLGHQAVASINGSAPTATQIVTHRCGLCHNGLFHNSGNRDNFNVADFPAALPTGMKEKIIARLTAPQDSIGLMPPSLYADLTDAQVQAIVQAMP